MTRREVLTAGATLGAGLALDPLLRRLSVHERATSGTPARLSDIEHVVIMIQENRSFDHYFGTLRGVRGFGDRASPGVFGQRNATGSTVSPFHVDADATDGGCTVDPDHTWGTQHRSIAGGAMNGWLASRRATLAPIAMGYFDERDISYYFALARAFTLCDHYFCSAIGPTDPNRSYAMTGTIDPGGRAGGPLIDAGRPGQRPPAYSWPTMPEALESRGLSWKIYSAPDSTKVDGDNTVLFFTQYHSNPTLAAKGLTPTFDDFLADAAAGDLPQVSWVVSPVKILEHPIQSSPRNGEFAVDRVLRALTSRRDSWKRTVLFLTWDENGGFFDHVAPPLPPPGTPEEFVTVAPLPSVTEGIAGPIGLGPRVPLLVVSPFSRGGFVSSDVFDHTSLLRFLETRFGVEVPNLSAWRRETCGDLTSALNLAAPDPSVPRLRAPPRPRPGKTACRTYLQTYPKRHRAPAQAPGKPKRPSGGRTP